MKKIYLALIASFLLLVSCGTAIQTITPESQAYKSIPIESIPGNAKVYVNDKLVSNTTPASISLPVYQRTVQEGFDYESYQGINLKVVKEGYDIYEKKVKPQAAIQNNMYFWKWPDGILCELKKNKKSVYETDPTIPIGAAKERVTRDNPGQTSLERTIIRWYFDSAPQGARIFWRVISSVPNEVKNTNELWLGSTPFEETRSFNIQGLTYENSRDVQIEIKVKRKGYIDQNKRFNVRQAIDQQEISSFFDMVEE